MSNFKIKPIQFVLFLGLFFFFQSGLLAQSEISKEVEYVSPKPNSVYNFPSTNIIITYHSELLSTNNLKYTYEIRCNGKTIPFKVIANSKRTILLKPLFDLPPNQKIIVKQNRALSLANKSVAKQFSYHFKTTQNLNIGFVDNSNFKDNFEKLVKEGKQKAEFGTGIQNPLNQKLSKQIPLVVRQNNLGDEKRFYFITTINYQLSTKNRMMIINEEGKIVFERFTPNYCLDFKQLEENRFSYYDWKDTCYYVLDETFSVIDTVKAGNGMVTDNHDIQMDKVTGNYWVIGQQVVTMDLSEIVLGGQQDARVLGMVIQEINHQKDVVFEWKSLDYIPVQDAINIDLTNPGIIDYMHTNSIDLESDTSFLLSSRHLNEVTRINRKSGNVIWRMGLNGASKSFRFANDPEGFTYQHDASRLANGNILIFDNGNFKPGERYSRVVEYQIDDINLVATKVWEYKSNDAIVSDFMGGAQRLPNGNTVIGWGGTIPTFTEVDSDGQVVFEASTPLWCVSYRAYHFDVESILKNASIQNTLKDTIEFCNEDSISILFNINNWIRANFDGNTPDSLIQVNFQNSKEFNVISWNPLNGNDIYSFSNHQIYFNYAFLNQKDTTICANSRILHVSVENNCSNIEYLWSNGSTENSINIDPSLTGSASYWVRIGNAQFSNIDSFHLEISKMVPYEIFGKENFEKPFEIATYSVPFDPSYSYKWDVTNGNIISGYATNAIQVQWGKSDSSLIYSTIINQFGCKANSKHTVQLPSSTNGIYENGIEYFEVYPNPFTDKIALSIFDSGELSLVDELGKIVMTKNVTIGETLEIQTQNFAKGIYVLEVKNSKGVSRTKLLKTN